jgi:hypothetical protein
MALQQFMKIYNKHYSDGNQRKGQAAFNALYEMSPVLADKIRTTEFDPFYQDSKIPAFMREVFGSEVPL